jgi:predicted transcriptional regulator
MTVTVTLTLDDETDTYLKRIAADQGRTPAEVASWIVTEDLRRERTIDADLLARLDDTAARPRQRPAETCFTFENIADSERQERAGA